MWQLVIIILGSVFRWFIGCFCAWLVSKGVLEKIPDAQIVSHAVDQLTGWAGILLVLGWSVWRTKLLQKFGTVNPVAIKQQKEENEKIIPIITPAPAISPTGLPDVK